MTTPTQVLSDEQVEEIWQAIDISDLDVLRDAKLNQKLRGRLARAVLASIVPTVDAKDERAAFDTWMRDCEGYPYAGHYANLMWKAWQARSALAQPSAAKNAQPVGYLPACELDRLNSGHDANLRSAKFGSSSLDGDVPVFIEASLTNHERIELYELREAAARDAPAVPAQAEPVAWEMDWPEYSYDGMGCGLEDRNITDRYDAMKYGWDEAIEHVGQILERDGPLYAAPQPAQTEPAADAQADTATGWKLMPTPHGGRAGLTDAMMRAFYTEFDRNSKRGDFERLNAGYNALLKAAPDAPAQTADVRAAALKEAATVADMVRSKFSSDGFIQQAAGAWCVCEEIRALLEQKP
ncbi:hypothetical protein [Paraburkholderia saeva]|uniref:DUF551 domain-containing protein n=1 Tax=Paraburkholderia saeva TaxID=2777537 RepID=A0A9N8RXC2_9BURK|nr:hypothetical protein [Paraburkholderia saeva]CAG4900477.1 hypothetical protein LMG31841_02882 [Paraburkholderia saeva]